MNIQEIDKQYVAGTYARFPLLLTSGKGSLVYDENGKEYIDLGTGIAVNTFGIGDEEWKAAVTAQLDKIKGETPEYVIDRLKFKLWDFDDVIQVHDLLEQAYTTIGKVSLFPESFF